MWVEDILSSMPDKDRVSIRLLDCVETEEEEHVEGMKEPAGDSHHEMHGEEKHEGSVHEIDEHVWTSPVNASVIVEKIKEVLIQKKTLKIKRRMRKTQIDIRQSLHNWISGFEKL